MHIDHSQFGKTEVRDPQCLAGSRFDIHLPEFQPLRSKGDLLAWRPSTQRVHYAHVDPADEAHTRNLLVRGIEQSRLIAPERGEIELRIEQHLLGSEKGLDKIERICAHEQSLAQCRGWIREYLPQAELIGMSSNAAGARRARDEEGTAAIGPDVAADVYDLEILVNNIEDRADNATRFLVVGRKLLAASGNDKTTVLVSTSDTAGGAGVLHHLLQPLAEYDVSMTRIESRPSRRKKWDYVFFIDIDGHAEESPAAEALAELKERSSLFRVLGAYPKAVD